MTRDEDKESDRNLQQDILSGRQFTLADVIGKEGGSFLKGESPVPPLMQAVAEINAFVAANLEDSSGALQAVLQSWVKNDREKVSNYFNSPLVALRQIIEAILNNEELFYEFVRQVDFKWGQIYGERPYFQRPGQPAHPLDEYSHESVREKLVAFLETIS
ncbi:MAG: hypothetical protein SXA11_07080 [Cyanobacteriota bacterium]|nr:hypothetical protein [Cyanobacteriota bacterium]